MTSSLIPTSNDVIAINACKYAREFILEGSTQIINNTYSIFKRNQLGRAVRDIRNFLKEFNEFSLELDGVIRNFYQSINNCKKFSIGNCHELALMALDYVAKYAPNVDAEVYHIKGGDHVFLVIGRDPDSNLYRPETWGDKAYICDPWSDKVYLASDYLSQTKNYYHSNGVNCIEDFNCRKHRLHPIDGQNTNHIRNASSEDHLAKISELFESKSKTILSAVVSLEADLEKIASKIKEKYGERNDKYEILAKKISKLQALIVEIKDEIILQQEPGQKNYSEFKSELENKLIQHAKNFSETVKTSKHEATALWKYNNEKSLSSMFMRFFNIPPETVRNTNKAIEKARDIMDELKSTPKIPPFK